MASSDNSIHVYDQGVHEKKTIDSSVLHVVYPLREM